MTSPVPDPGSKTALQNKGCPLRQAQLRILSTTDVHMHLTGFDYVADAPTAQSGLSGLVHLIKQERQVARARGQACILVDNGDMFQGTPMADHIARQTVDHLHPAVGCINHLGYDAVGIGNHDIDFGLPYLRELARHLDAPMVSSNLQSTQNKAEAGHDPLQRSAVLCCQLPGTPDAIKVGILSVLPKQTEIWNRRWLQGGAQILPAARMLPQAVKDLRAAGADLVVLLAHMGITSDAKGDTENALGLAKIDGIDAMITGHTHRRFPGTDHPQGGGIDPQKGHLHAVPAVMAGHAGSDLGVVDLNLTRDDAGCWHVASHHSALIANTATTPRCPALANVTQTAHHALRTHLREPLGHTSQHLHNYFSLARPTATSACLAWAKMLHVKQAVAGTADALLPLLASSAAHTSGGRHGPTHYLSVPHGTVLRRHLAGLNPYNNQVVALRITKTELLRWLEHAASIFNRLAQGAQPKVLQRPQIPAFNFETVFGVTYTIDPTQPCGQRIGGLRWQGKPVPADQRFLMATNQFRAAGGGGYEVFAPEKTACQLDGISEAMLIAAFGMTGDHDALPWQFRTPQGARAELRTAPEAVDFLDEIAHLQPEVLGLSDTGFLRLGLTL